MGGKIPPWRLGQGNDEDNITNIEYPRYAFIGSAGGVRIPKSFPTPNFDVHNYGYLYALKYIADGGIMFCPALYQRSSPFSAAHYSPLLTTPNQAEFPSENPFIRSSYLHNPRIIDPARDTHRRFRKTSQFRSPQVFSMDLIGQGNPPDADDIPHFRNKGMNALLTDGCVTFSKKSQVWNIMRQGSVIRNNVTEVNKLCSNIDGNP